MANKNKNKRKLSRREKKRQREAFMHGTYKTGSVCSNCGHEFLNGESGHFVPPSGIGLFRTEGFYICEEKTDG
jgi:ribosomal protein L32